MGIDGRQTLQIRGPASIITQIQATGAMLLNAGQENLYISERFFANAKVSHRSEKYIVFEYEYRNFPIYGYLEELLKTYNQCWIKNEYSTEVGICGMWIGRFNDNIPEIQQLEWTELSIEERDA